MGGRAEMDSAVPGMKLELISRAPEAANGAPPLLFVHGGFHAAWSWDEYFLPWFAARGFEAHALSLRGHGASQGAQGIDRWRLRDYVEDLRATVGCFPRAPVLIGHSLGAAVILKYLEREVTPLFVLLAPTPPRGFLLLLLIAAARHPVLFARMVHQRSLAPVRHLFEAFFFRPDIEPEARAAFVERLQSESFAAVWDIAIFDRIRLGAAKAPALVVGGLPDVSLPRGLNARLARVLGAEFVEVDAAHDIMLDRNWEDAARSIATWIEAHVRDTGKAHR